MKKVYVVDLTKEEKAELLDLVGKGEARARKMNRAHILLLANEGRTDKDIAQALHTSVPWPLLPGHPEGMKIRGRSSPWSDVGFAWCRQSPYTPV